MSDIQVERLDASHYRADPKLISGYQDTFNLHGLLDSLAFNANLILCGPAGIGKSLAVASWCGVKGYPLVTFDCSEDVRRQHLLGHYTQRSNLETPFILGPVTTAFELANEVGHCVLVLEEVNALSQAIQKVLNGVCDFRKKVELPEVKRIFRLKENAHLFVVGTMNESTYGGVYELNRDLKSRFRILALGYPPPVEEKKAIRKALSKKATDNLGAKDLDHIVTLAQETRQRAMEYSLSTRDIVQIVEDAVQLGLESALRLSVGKFDGNDRDTYIQRVKAHFPAFT